MHNTVAKALCLSRPHSITNAGTCGLRLQNHQECQAQFVFKHTYITNLETTPADAIISAANQITETLCTHAPINMCEEDLENLQRLETIFARASQTNSDVKIKTTPIRTPPRVQTTTPDQDTNKARTAALQELDTQPRVHRDFKTSNNSSK